MYIDIWNEDRVIWNDFHDFIDVLTLDIFTAALDFIWEPCDRLIRSHSNLEISDFPDFFAILTKISRSGNQNQALTYIDIKSVIS